MKNKKIIVVILVFLIVILAAFAGVYAYIALDILKTPKQLFGKYLDNQIYQVQNANTGVLKTIQENLKNNNSETELEVKLDSEEKSQIKIGFKKDSANSEGGITVKYSSNDEEIANYEFYANKEKIAAKIPELNDKPFAIKFETLIEQGEKYIEENSITDKDYNFSLEDIERYKNELKKIYNKYLEDVKANFTDDKFTAEKKVEVNVNGTAMTANRYSFNLKTSELKNIMINLLENFSNEEILSDFLTEDQILEVKNTISKIKDNLDDTDLLDIDQESTLKLCVYEASGKTVKVELKVDEEIVAEFMVVKPSEAETNIILSSFNKKSDTNEVGVTNTLTYSINVENETTTSVTVKTLVDYSEEDVEALKKEYEDQEYSFYTPEMIEERYKDTNTSQKVTFTLNGEKATCKLSLDAFKDLGIQISKMQVNYKFGSEVKFLDLKDAINLEDYIDNEEKASELMMECIQNLQEHPNSLLNNASSTIEDTSFSEYDDSDNYSFSPSSTDYDKERIEELVKDALDDCLDSYKRDLEEDENTNIADYLTVNKISEMILSSFVSDLELIDGETLKCEYMDEVYYIKLVLNADTLKVDKATAYTESEYENL